MKKEKNEKQCLCLYIIYDNNLHSKFSKITDSSGNKALLSILMYLTSFQSVPPKSPILNFYPLKADNLLPKISSLFTWVILTAQAKVSTGVI